MLFKLVFHSCLCTVGNTECNYLSAVNRATVDITGVHRQLEAALIWSHCDGDKQLLYHNLPRQHHITWHGNRQHTQGSTSRRHQRLDSGQLHGIMTQVAQTTFSNATVRVLSTLAQRDLKRVLSHGASTRFSFASKSILLYCTVLCSSFTSSLRRSLGLSD